MLSEKPWNVEGFVRLLLGILFCVAMFILLEAALEHFLGKDKLADGTLLNLVLGSLSLHGSILLGTAVFLKWQHISWRDAFGFSTPPLARAILFGFVAALVFLPAEHGVAGHFVEVVEPVSRAHVAANGGRGIGKSQFAHSARLSGRVRRAACAAGGGNSFSRDFLYGHQASWPAARRVVGAARSPLR